MWSLASAKQQFSEVVRLAEHTPQPIMRHHKEVAVLISARNFEEFKAWQATQTSDAKTAGQRFLDGMVEVRHMLMAADPQYQGIELPPRTDRANAMIDMLEQEYPLGENADGTPRLSAAKHAT
jgi:prevent-host-death family protein